MDKSTTNVLTRPDLLLGDRPRVSIPLAPGAASLLQTWLVIDLPSPAAAERPEERFCADPRLPESEIVLRWGTMPALPKRNSKIQFPRTNKSFGIWFLGFGSSAWEVAEQSWNLEQDLTNHDR